jgi:hypothetical protein
MALLVSNFALRLIMYSKVPLGLLGARKYKRPSNCKTTSRCSFGVSEGYSRYRAISQFGMKEYGVSGTGTSIRACPFVKVQFFRAQVQTV